MPTQHINPFTAKICKHDQRECTFRLRRAEILGIVRLQEWIPVLRILPAAVSWALKQRVHPQIFDWAVIRQQSYELKMYRERRQWFKGDYTWTRGLMLLVKGARQPSCATRQSWTLTCAPPSRHKILLPRSAVDITITISRSGRTYAVNLLARLLSCLTCASQNKKRSKIAALAQRPGIDCQGAGLRDGP